MFHLATGNKDSICYTSRVLKRLSLHMFVLILNWCFRFSDWKKCTATFGCSEDAVQGYMERYAVSSRLSHAPTCEDYTRIHNGGPDGYKTPATLGYWDKVKSCLGQKKFRIVEKDASKIKKNITNDTFRGPI